MMKNFNIEHLTTLLGDGKIDTAKMYVLQYFFKVINPVSVLYYKPTKNIFETLEKISNVIPSKLEYKYFKDDKVVKINICDWFMNENNKVYTVINAPNKPLSFIEDDLYYLNKFSGFTYDKNTIPKYAEYDKKTRESVNKIWDHIRLAWCNDEKESYTYSRKWLIRMINGIKNHTALYMKSEQGIGKGLILELINHILGSNAVCRVANNTECITGTFNGILEGKVALFIEELDQVNGSTWNRVYEALQAKVTDPIIMIRKMREEAVPRDNYLNIIICCNNHCVVIPLIDRRFVQLTTSDRFVKNDKYFSELAEITSDPEVRKCFYAYCCECMNDVDIKTFKDHIIPATHERQDYIIEHMPTEIKFIKDTYVCKNTGIKELFNEFYNKYTQYTDKPISDIALSKLLFKLNIPRPKKAQNKLWVDITKIDLYKLFISKRWIHEIDQINDPDYTKLIEEAQQEKQLKELNIKKSIILKQIPDLTALLNAVELTIKNGMELKKTFNKVDIIDVKNDEAFMNITNSKNNKDFIPEDAEMIDKEEDQKQYDEYLDACYKDKDTSDFDFVEEDEQQNAIDNLMNNLDKGIIDE